MLIKSLFCRSSVLSSMVCLVIGLAFSSHALAQRINLEPGLWEYTNTLQMGEMGNPQTQVFEDCVTQEQLDEGEFMFQEMDGCELVEQRISFDEMTYVLNCEGPEGTQVSVSAELTFDGDTAEGVIQNTVAAPMGSLVMTVNLSARRKGPCPGN